MDATTNLKGGFAMQKHVQLYLLATMALGLLVLWGCPKKTEMTTSQETQTEKVTAPATPSAAANGSDSKSAAAAAGSGDGYGERALAAGGGLQPVYFDYDRSSVRADAGATMKENADWLKAHPAAKIRIEGNCDERGTKEYNVALGQRRAATAKKYLTDLGIASGRISLLSYGKEKPVCTADSETCWQKNRRDDFAVVTP
jgi:peptidoglycan-associated lipoprotein